MQVPLEALANTLEFFGPTLKGPAQIQDRAGLISDLTLGSPAMLKQYLATLFDMHSHLHMQAYMHVSAKLA